MTTQSTIDSFFDFLKEHINSDFKNAKNEYTIENYNFNELGQIELPSIEDGYFLIFPKDYIDENQYAMDEINGKAYKKYLNPVEQKQFKKLIKSGEIIKYSFYNDLNILYRQQFTEFYENLNNRLLKGFSSNEVRKKFLEDLIKGIEFQKDRVNNSFFTVKDNDGNQHLLLHDRLSKLIKKIKEDYLTDNSLVSNERNKTKQPSAKVLMGFVREIDKSQTKKIYPQSDTYKNNDEKFEHIANEISKRFNYEYKGSTLENNEYKIEGYSLEVYKLLLFWGFNTEATKYNSKHNK